MLCWNQDIFCFLYAELDRFRLLSVSGLSRWTMRARTVKRKGRLRKINRFCFGLCLKQKIGRRAGRHDHLAVFRSPYCYPMCHLLRHNCNSQNS